MAKTNLTLQLDAETILRAKVVAARRGTSISALVAKQLEELVADEERYDAAHRRALEILTAASPRGGRTWQRDSLHER